jgi:hypothetical protein
MSTIIAAPIAPGGNLIDFIRAALVNIKIKTREEELTENFQAWRVAKSLTLQQAQYLRTEKSGHRQRPGRTGRPL